MHKSLSMKETAAVVLSLSIRVRWAYGRQGKVENEGTNCWIVDTVGCFVIQNSSELYARAHLQNRAMSVSKFTKWDLNWGHTYQLLKLVPVFNAQFIKFAGFKLIPIEFFVRFSFSKGMFMPIWKIFISSPPSLFSSWFTFRNCCGDLFSPNSETLRHVYWIR